jgi:putative transposase
MPDYRRNRVEGGTYFFTVGLADRHGDLLVRELDALRAAVSRGPAFYPFMIDAWVVLSAHLDAVWILPDDDTGFSARWPLVKNGFSARVAEGESRSVCRIAQGERGVWQRRFWERTIGDKADFRRYVDYAHVNPVKHGLAGKARGWRFSSCRRAVARGHYLAEWGDVEEMSGECGERPEG